MSQNVQPSYTSYPLQHPLLPKPFGSSPIEKLTSSELQAIYKVLCYTYDERYFRGHKCNSQFFLLIQQEDVEDSIKTPDLESLQEFRYSFISLQPCYRIIPKLLDLLEKPNNKIYYFNWWT